MTYTYYGITAPTALWRSVGINPYKNGRSWPMMDNEEGEADGHSRDIGAASDGDLIEARTQVDTGDEKTLAWLIGERRWRYEESARNQANLKAAQDNLKAAEERVHAARIERQAALIRAKVARVEIDLSSL